MQTEVRGAKKTRENGFRNANALDFGHEIALQVSCLEL
jgi:hypothetical protein